mmetsp:Transcript_92957/g.245657  ORF Transcript_92957/g.245657 Transcript_92957/m.245657 type:complete len:500 (-) Transcript_92957:41-1540(-)
MCLNFGVAPNPMYGVTVKAFSNFFVGIILLLGVSRLATLCCSRLCPPERFNAYTGTPVRQNGEEDNEDLLREAATSSDEGPGYMPPLYPGDKVRYSSGQVGIVVQRYEMNDDYPGKKHISLANIPLAIIMKDGSEKSYGPSVEGVDSDVWRDDVTELKTAIAEKTLRSAFLAPIRLKFLSVGFQVLGIASSCHAFVQLILHVPPTSWERWETVALLITQHSAAITLVVALAQTGVMAFYVVGSAERRTAAVVAIAAAIVMVPAVGAVITVGYVFLVAHVLPGMLLGTAAIPLLAVLIVLIVDSRALVGSGDVALAGLGGETTNEAFRAFEQMTVLHKAWYFLTTLLPFHAKDGNCEVFVVISLIVVASVGVPAWWVLLGGAAAAPAADAFLLEVTLPLVALILLAAFKGGLIAHNFDRAGVVLVMVFALAHLLSTVLVMAVPVSIISRGASTGIRNAVAVAFSAREGHVFAACLRDKLAEELSARAARLRYSQLVSIFS